MTIHFRRVWCPAIHLAVVFIGLLLVTATQADAPASPGKPVNKPAPAAEVAEQKQDFPAKPASIMPLDKVRIGAKGYGLTVFHGTKIEPFPVEVISVMRDFAPKRGVVWVRCSDPRLLQSGPVQGMSGSPIYLWEEGEKQEMGKGGKLIGAFAFGYSWTRDCYAGVQPIELMRDTGSRAVLNPDDAKADAKAGTKAGANSRRSNAAPAGEALRAMLGYAKQEGWGSDMTWKAEALADMLGVHSSAKKSEADTGDAGDDVTRFAPTNLKVEGKPFRMMLPMSVGNAGQAKWLAPLLAPMGIKPMAGPIGSLAGLPPTEIDPAKVKLEPGSVLSLPLAWGDADLNAAGTVTDVLPDGKVLGFGHAMFGEGAIALPMATGYIHFVVPRQSTSFKMGGTAVIKGSIVRDENAAVAGIREQAFKTTPVKITIVQPGKAGEAGKAGQGEQRKTYNYTMVQHNRLAPSLAAQLAAQSIEADTKLPGESTVKLTGTAMFEGNRKVEFNSLLAPAAGARVMSEILPSIGSMVQNTHQEMMLESLDLEMVITKKIEAVNLLSARIEKTEVAPGEKLKLTMTVQVQGESPTTKNVFIDVPDSLPEGRYPVSVTDGRSYLQQKVQNRPHLAQTSNADDVHALVQMVTEVRTDAYYIVMQLPRSGLALGRRELPNLPSSRKALIASAASEVANSYADTVEQIVPMNAVVVGRVAFELTVRKPASELGAVNKSE